MTDQDWTNISPEVAFHLIERHAEDWTDAGRMMEAWRDSQIDRLNAEWMAKCEELRKDAERYQWMRRRAVMIDESDDVITTVTLFKQEGPTGEFLDDQIDAAMAKKEGA